MVIHSTLVTPKQVARAIGVSESSLKRWCDQGLIRTTRTAGGHRKMSVSEVLNFIRTHDHKLVSPEILGLPAANIRSHRGLQKNQPRFAEALLTGDELLARQILFDLYLAGHSLSVLCDDLIAVTFREIGERWECKTADVYQERRACEITTRILTDLRQVQRPTDSHWRATGGTVEDDHYALPTAMVELVLRGLGISATSLGTSIPFPSLILAIQETRPKLFWLSVSTIREGLDFVSQFAVLSKACTAAHTALVVGGRALTDDLRRRMNYSVFCDTMQQLETFVQTLRHSSARPEGSSDFQNSAQS